MNNSWGCYLPAGWWLKSIFHRVKRQLTFLPDVALFEHGVQKDHVTEGGTLQDHSLAFNTEHEDDSHTLKPATHTQITTIKENRGLIGYYGLKISWWTCELQTGTFRIPVGIIPYLWWAGVLWHQSTEAASWCTSTAAACSCSRQQLWDPCRTSPDCTSHWSQQGEAPFVQSSYPSRKCQARACRASLETETAIRVSCLLDWHISPICPFSCANPNEGGLQSNTHPACQPASGQVLLSLTPSFRPQRWFCCIGLDGVLSSPRVHMPTSHTAGFSLRWCEALPGWQKWHLELGIKKSKLQ